MKRKEELADKLWKEIEAEAERLEEHAKGYVWERPADAKDPKEVYEEIKRRLKEESG